MLYQDVAFPRQVSQPQIRLEILSTYCRPRLFEINGVLADSEDFGSQVDLDRNMPGLTPRSCGDMRFQAIRPAPSAILEKFRITVTEYEEIAFSLERRLSFGCCNWCNLYKAN